MIDGPTQPDHGALWPIIFYCKVRYSATWPYCIYSFVFSMFCYFVCMTLKVYCLIHVLSMGVTVGCYCPLDTLPLSCNARDGGDDGVTDDVIV